MISNIINYIVYFITPFLLIIAPLHLALITLALFIFLNFLSAIICIKKNKNISLWRAIFNNKNLKRFFKKHYEYALAIVGIGFLEANILVLDVATTGGLFSLIRVTIITASIIEVNQLFSNIECVTGSNILTKITNLVPDPIKKYFQR